MVTTKTELYHLTITDAAELIKSKEISPVELTQAYLDRIEQFDGTVRAFTDLRAESALAAAKKAEDEIVAGDYKGPLHGIAFTAKDQLDSEGNPSSMRGPSEAMYDSDATPIARMKDAGAVYLGKVVMSSMDPIPQPRNPWNLEHGSGGSSSGSGASVSAGFCTASLGEDSAGSIRGPANFANLVGVIGTYGRVSRKGLAPMGWTLDRCGPLAYTVKDAAYVLGGIAGSDPSDYTSSGMPVDDYTSKLGEDIAGMVIGVPRKYIEARDVQPDIVSAFEAALMAMESLGARIEEIDIPNLDQANPVSMILFSNEMMAANYDHLHEWIETQPALRKKFLAMAAMTPASDYLQAQRLRAFLRQEFKTVMSKVDVIATPTGVATAPKYGETMDRSLMWMVPSFTAMFSIVGMPAMSVPAGFDSTGLPIGMQLAASPFEESTMLKAAYAYERSTPWHTRRAVL
jgi:aspartyl-tRNA(Asn)/glutamyl-tRNA(Gln) amidotransferase subunit A